MIDPRVSALDDDLDDLGESSDEEEMVIEEKLPPHRRPRSPSPVR